MASNYQNLFTLSEFRQRLKLPLVVAKKLIIWGQIETVEAVDGTIRITESGLKEAQKLVDNPQKRIRLYLRSLGPGLITGAADDDPSGIGTYSSAGAFFGYKLLWMSLWLLPLMLAVQETCARIGIVTNRGLAGVLKRHYHRWLVALIVILLIAANVVNIGADLQAMAASMQMLIKINFYLIAAIFAAIIIILEIIIPYYLYAKYLKWLVISLLSYVVCGFVIHPDWLKVFKDTIVPNFVFNKSFIFGMIAIFGTTISPYLFFWQTSEEVEENPDGGLVGKKALKTRIATMRTDVKTGMFFSNLIFFFIIITTAQVLNQKGITEITSAEQAALALEPLAGEKSFLLFSLGIIGAGFLAIPVLAGSGAYALSELLHWREGLSQKFKKARNFYLVIAVSILLGFLLNIFGLNPIYALYLAAFINGLIALPLLFVIMVVGNEPKIMGEETHPRWVKFFGWMAVIFSFLAVIAYLFLQIL